MRVTETKEREGTDKDTRSTSILWSFSAEEGMESRKHSQHKEWNWAKNHSHKLREIAKDTRAETQRLVWKRIHATFFKLLWPHIFFSACPNAEITGLLILTFFRLWASMRQLWVCLDRIVSMEAWRTGEGEGGRKQWLILKCGCVTLI